MIETLLVSKPVAPPWNDSGKVLVRDLVRHCTAVRHRIFTVPGHSLGLDHVTEEPLYSAPGRFSPALLQNLRVLLRLLRPDRQRIYHFFFAPNPRTSRVSRLALTFKSRATVQTVMSVPKTFESVGDLLFADRVVALSEHTRARLVEAGVEGVVHIPPGIEVRDPISPEECASLREAMDIAADRPLVVFPGDYEFSRAAHTLADAIPRVLANVDATFVYACRIKREASREIEREIRGKLADAEASGRVRFVGETDRIRELLAAADLVVLPSESSYAKMDIPLVLLEAMAEYTPVLVADVAPINEVLGVGSDRPQAAVGIAVPPVDSARLADAVAGLLADPEGLRKMGRAGRDWVETRFSAPSMGAAHERLYLDLVGTL